MTELRPVRNERELRAAMALRREVFVVEQRVPVELEADEHDDGALHLVAVQDGAVVATCRLVAVGDTAKLGRMAVATGARRRGLASRLLAEAEAQARTRGMRRVALAAQTDALGLYERAGYSGYGERFMEAGLEHLMIEKALGGGSPDAAADDA